jgi:hypothetical protein
MSFESDKAQLVKELADAQAQVRAEYGMADRPAPSTAQRDEASRHGRRMSLISD